MSRSVFGKTSCLIILIITCFICFLFFDSCSNHSQPLEPEAPDPLAFFPLKKGHAAEYNYKFSFYYYNSTAYSKNLDRSGTFRIEVVQVLEKETAINFKIKSTFLIKNEIYSFENIGGPYRDTSYVRENFFTETQFDLLLEKDTLWYVTDAPSFERLEEGQRSVCMAGPIASGGKIDLKLFDFPVAYGLFSTLGVWELQRKENDDFYIYGGTVSTTDATILTVRNKGISKISIYAWVPSTNQPSEQKAEYVLVE
jgi:hypothetical protein